MRIGLVIGLHGTAEKAPRWRQILQQIRSAEEVGFDLAVIEDALLISSGPEPIGYWESTSMAGALLGATGRIELGHSVINAPYRAPGLVAKIADTLDEISGGRYILGVGVGNTPEDYEPFGFAHRSVARFAEWIEIVHGLLKDGLLEFEGEHFRLKGARLTPRGPRPMGPPIVVAARGPKMMRLAARFADEWNWWATAETETGALRATVDDIERACVDQGRDPASLRRSLDVYSLDPLNRAPGAGDGLIRGDSEAIAEKLLAFGQLGFGEVRCDIVPAEPAEDLPRMIEALADVVDRVHAG